MRIDRALVAIRKDGFVDGACFSDESNVAEFRQMANEQNLEVREVSREFARSVLLKNINEFSLFA